MHPGEPTKHLLLRKHPDEIRDVMELCTWDVLVAYGRFFMALSQERTVLKHKRFLEYLNNDSILIKMLLSMEINVVSK